MKRFYKEASVAPVDEGFAVQLDGKGIKTPKREPLVVPTQPLAEALAAEWDAQGKTVSPESMRLNKLVNTTIDHIAHVRDEVIDDIAKFGETDLLCYRSDFPLELQDLQTEKWQPVLDWMEERFGTRLKSTAGVIHIPQEPDTLTQIRKAVAAHNDFQLTALHVATTVTGSVCLALALSHEYLTLDDTWDVATVDDRFQEQRWGKDEEASDRLTRRHRDLSVAAQCLELLKG